MPDVELLPFQRGFGRERKCLAANLTLASWVSGKTAALPVSNSKPLRRGGGLAQGHLRAALPVGARVTVRHRSPSGSGPS